MARQLALLDSPPDWHIDDETREVGREGLARARAALAAAHQPATAEPSRGRGAVTHPSRRQAEAA